MSHTQEIRQPRQDIIDEPGLDFIHGLKYEIWADICREDGYNYAEWIIPFFDTILEDLGSYDMPNTNDDLNDLVSKSVDQTITSQLIYKTDIIQALSQDAIHFKFNDILASTVNRTLDDLVQTVVREICFEALQNKIDVIKENKDRFWKSN
jgi:hypothetical protein